MRILITGGTGLIGRALSEDLVEDGHEVIVLSRNPERSGQLPGVQLAGWDGKTERGWSDFAEGAHAIINLAGENISTHRWTEEFKKRILGSRLNAGKAVVSAVKKVRTKPSVVIQASGVGYYGSRGDDGLDEGSAPGDDFLARVALQWEDSTKSVEALQVRHIIIRSGAVLSTEGGALKQLLKSHKFLVGGALGNGKQWFPWIHIADEVRAIRFVLEHKKLTGPFNLAAPQTVQSSEFSDILGQVIGSHSRRSVPEFMLRMMFGEMVDVLIASQRVLPQRLLKEGFQFKFEDAKSTLKDLLE
jgi:uncharacterized protein (TIGR01777 family)